jgi:putative protein kinase ArgK-like GTPase of G3E family
MTDIYLVLLSPGGGDELQGIKKGIIELADILIVNKADGNLEATAKSTVLDYKNALKLQKGRHPKWSVPVLPMSAIESTGIDDVWNEILKLQNHLYENDIFSKNRSSQDKKWLKKKKINLIISMLGSQDEKWMKKKKKNLIISLMESEDEILEKIEQNIMETDKQLMKKFSHWIKSIFKSRNS